MYDYIPISDGVFYKECVYIYISVTNALYKIDLKTDVISCVAELPYGKVGVDFQFVTLLCHENKIYFIPQVETKLVIYDIEKSSFSVEEIGVQTKKAGFMAACIVNKILFMFGTDEPIIKCFNIVNGETKEIVGIETNPNYKKKNDDVYFRQQLVIANNKIYIPFCNADALLILDTESLFFDVFDLNIGGGGYSAINNDEGYLWLGPRNQSNEIISINMTKREVKKYCLSNTDDLRGIIGISIFDGRQLFFAGNEIKENKFVNLPIDVIGGNYGFMHQQEDTVIAFSRDNNRIEIWRKNMLKKNINIKLNAKGRFVKEIIAEGKLMEDKFVNLTDYISAIL